MSGSTEKSYIIPFNKRGKVAVVLSVLATLILGSLMVLVWWTIAGGAHDATSILFASALTIGFGCSLTAVITGHLEWILLGYCLPY